MTVHKITPEMTESGDRGDQLPGFSFNSLPETIDTDDPTQINTLDVMIGKWFRIGANGEVEFHGYEAGDIIAILIAHAEHR